jgi:thiamine biosynthesis lipoprotein
MYWQEVKYSNTKSIFEKYQYYPAHGLFCASVQAMHTRLDVVFADIQEITGALCLEEIFEEVNRIEKKYNRFNASSQLSQLNRFAATDWFPLDPETYAILSECILLSLQTNSYFDITVQSTERTSIRDVYMDHAHRKIKFNFSTISLDLNGYIKGYTLSRIQAVMSKYSIINALINFGNSSIFASGRHPSGDAWKIGLPDHFNPAETAHVFNLTNCFLTTSGTLFDKNNFPVINPATNKQVSGNRTFSVITESPTEGEAITTALVAASDDTKTFPFLKNFAIYEVIRVNYTQDENGAIHQEKTSLPVDKRNQC